MLEYLYAINNIYTWSDIVDGVRPLGSYGEPWVAGFIMVLFKTTMMPCPEDRKRILDIKRDLGMLYPRLDNPSYLGLAPSQSASTALPEPHQFARRKGKARQQPPDPPTTLQVPQSLPPRSQQLGVELSREREVLEDTEQFHAPSPTSGNSNALQPNVDRNQESEGRSSSGTNGTGAAESSKFSFEITNPPYVISLPQQTITANTYIPVSNKEFSHQTTTPLPEKGLILAAYLEPKGRRIAMLCESEVFVFDTFEPNRDQRTLRAISSLREPSVRIAGSLLAIFGSKGQFGEIIAELHDWTQEIIIKDLDGAYEARTRSGAYEQDTLCDICLSSTGIAACAYKRHVNLYIPQSYNPSRLTITEDNETIGSIAFDGHGQLLFLWLEGHDHSHVKIFQINISDRSVQLHANLCFSKEALSTKRGGRIFPSANAAFCVVYKDRRGFLAQPSSSQPHTAKGHLKPPLPLSPVLTKEIVAGLVYHNNTLLCLEHHKKHLRKQKQIISYSINSTERDGRSFASIDTAHQVLGKLDVDIDVSAGIAIENSEDQVQLVVYASKNKILRYSQSR